MSLIQKILQKLEKRHQLKLFNYLKYLDINLLIDVGAHEGNFLNNLNKKKIKSYYLFEPSPNYYKKLTKKFKNNNKIKIFKIALSLNKKNTYFLLNKEGSTSTLESTINKNHFLYKIKTKYLKLKYYKKIIVKTNLVENYFLNTKLENSFLKIDTEGNELNVLKGSKKIISKLKYIMIEVKHVNFYNDANYNDILKFLNERNFYKIKNFSTFPYIYRDILFKNKNL